MFGAITVALVSHELRTSLDSSLRDRARAVAELAVSAPAVLTQAGALETPVSARQLVVQVIDARGRILARSLTSGVSLLPEDRLAREAIAAGRSGYEDVEIAGRPFRLYAAPIPQAFGPAAGGVVLVASETKDIEHTVHHLGFVLLLVGLAIAILAAAAAVALTGRGLRPLRLLVTSAGEIERTADPARRLADTGDDDELGRLTGMLNRMLASLERARTGERRFLADASHELRTPVTSLLGNVEYAVRHGADAEVLADLKRDAERLARLVDALLALEREGAAGPELERVALDQVVSRTVAELDTGEGRVVPGRIESATVRGDPDALARALRNLIENGLVHGPADGRVTVSLTTEGGTARITVSDEGRGPDPDERERLFERFYRGAGTSERPGSGLGLSIVATIVRRHRGTIEIDGAAFAIVLPEDSHAALSEI